MDKTTIKVKLIFIYDNCIFVTLIYIVSLFCLLDHMLPVYRVFCALYFVNHIDITNLMKKAPYK